MSWLQNVGKTIGKAATDTGHAVGKVASNPWVEGLTAAALAATGVGVPAAAAIMAAEKGGGALLKKGGNIGDAAKGAVIGGAEGATAGLAGRAIRGAGGIGGAIKGAGGDVLGAAKGLLGKAGSLGSDAVGLAKGVRGGSGGANSLLDTALLGGTIADQAATKARQTSLQNQGLKYATDAYDAKAPLRAEGLSMLQQQNVPDLSSIFGNSPNPFAKGKPSYQLGTQVPLAPAPSVGGPVATGTGTPIARPGAPPVTATPLRMVA